MRKAARLVLIALLAAPSGGWAAGDRALPSSRPASLPSLPSLPATQIPGRPSAVSPSRLAPTAAAPLSRALGSSAAPHPAARPASQPLLTVSELADMQQSGRLEYGLDKAFDNAGASAPQPLSAAATPPSTPESPEADDGGGDAYPSRSIRFNGKWFRSALFRPNVPVETEIVRALESAKKSIHLSLYEFKLSSVLDALRAAKARGVEIHIVLDHSSVFPRHEPQSDYKPRRSREIWALLREGFDVKVLRGLSDYGINHNKFAVIDHGEKQSLAIFGSYNWAWTAEHSHYENAVFSIENHRVEALKSYWDWLRSMAVPEPQARDYDWPAVRPAPPVAVSQTVAFNGLALPSLVLSPTRETGRSIEDWLVAAMDATQKSLDISVFALRSTRIAQAIARAKDRGVRVRVIIDEGQAASVPFGPFAQWLASQGVEVRVLAGPDPNSGFPLAQKSHNKLAIFDGKIVETGSANFTKYAAAANFENAHFLDHPKDVGAFLWVYERMFSRARPLAVAGAAPTLPSDAELIEETSRKPPPMPPRPEHPKPDPSVPPARPIAFNGATLPSRAFRPDTPIEPLIVKAIDSAKTSVRLALYEFNLDEMMNAVRRAKARGLKVEIVVDHSHVYTTGKDSTNRPRKPSPEIQALINEGFDLLTLRGEKGGIMHNKYVLLDAEDKGLVLWGSYNFADTAEFNHYENVVFSNDPHSVSSYLAYFNYKRELASAIDHEKLEKVLTRGLEPEDDYSPERLSHEPRDSKFDAPPYIPGPTINLNGEKFQPHYFSPQGGILDAWVRAIGAARKSVKIAMFGFYAREVADALVEAVMKVRAEGRDIQVQLVLDAGQSTLAKFDGVPVSRWFAQRGFDIRMLAGPNEDGDPMYEKQHNKFLIVDDKFLMTGSFNLSPTAENLSFENENVVVDPIDVAGYVEFFLRMYNRGAAPRAPRGQADAPAPSTPDSVSSSSLPGL